MPVYKTTLLFQDNNVPSGWAEVYYQNASGDDQAAAVTDDLANRRAVLLSGNTELTGWRCGQVDLIRQTLSVNGLHRRGPDDTGLADHPWDSLLCRFNSGAKYSRPLFLRGIPDLVFNPPDAASVTAREAWYSRLNDYLNSFVTGARWLIRAEDKEQPDNVPRRIINTAVAAGLSVTFTTDVDHLFSVGDTVVVYSRQWAPPMGRRVVQAVGGPDTFTVPYTGVRKSTTGSQSARHILIVYKVIDRWNIERANHRDTGRPFGLLRGRRSKRVC
jgi:hypothetical protein